MDRELRRLQADNRLPPEIRRFDEHLWLNFYTLSFLSESYRRLRTNILHVHMASPLKTIMVTSPNPYEGKTTTVCNLAISFSETQKRVLVVDADLRRPTVHAKFGLSPECGIADIVTGTATFEEAVQRNVVENLDVLCCGTILRNPAGVLGSRSMQSFLEQMKKQYTWILVDTPPILIVNDAAVLSTMVDGTMLVVSSGSTRLATMERSIEFLQGAGGAIIGTVLNRFDAQRVYGRYYGSYRYGHYGYGHEYYSSSNGKGTHKASRLT
jgi:capsular exopolysaccharide synthesis family protein